MKVPRFSTFLFLAALSTAAMAESGTGEGVRARLVTDSSVPVGGKPFLATIVLDLDPGWHTYWQFPGDSGIPTKVEWQLPEGWRAGALEFSVPQLFKEPGDLVIFGYQSLSLLRAVITPPKDISINQSFELKAKVSWLACKELCVPGSAHVSTRIYSEAGNSSNGGEATIPKGLWPGTGEIPYQVSISLKEGNAYIAFNGINKAVYELFPDPVGEGGSDVTVGAPTIISSGGSVSINLPWKNNKIPFKALLVEKQGNDTKSWWISKNSIYHTSKTIRYVSIEVLISALFSGFLGGLILNLMPCVLPVISLKIFGFIAQAGESPTKIMRHGLAFAAGIFLWFIGLGVLVIILKLGGSQVTWGAFQFQNPVFILVLSILVFLFALNLFGVFEITLPGRAGTSLDNVAARGGYSGSFFQGLFATLLATPCTAPFLGSALGFAFGQSPIVILAMFSSVAFGMALPYLLLCARPGWRNWIPRPGVWMERLKQFMGFPLLATNLWLLWVMEQQRGPDAALALLLLFLILGFCCWIYGISTNGATNRAKLVLLPFVLLVAAGSIFYLGKRIQHLPPVGVSPATQGGIDWVPYTPAALNTLLKEKKPVLLDFTASWCLTCQFNERTAINVPAVRKILQERGITAMKGDWTNADPDITAALKSFGRVGVPLAIYYPAEGDRKPVVLPELLTERIVVHTLGD